MTVEQVFTTFTSLTGVAALASVLVNIFKTFNIIKDGQATNVVTGLNLFGLVALFVLNLLGYANLIPVLDDQSGQLANVLATVFAFMYQLWASKKTHEAILKGMPLIGKSYTLEAEHKAAETGVG